MWLQVEEMVELEGKEIEVKNIYPDSIFNKIIEALIEIRRSGTHDTYMEFFGSGFAITLIILHCECADRINFLLNNLRPQLRRLFYKLRI